MATGMMGWLLSAALAVGLAAGAQAQEKAMVDDVKERGVLRAGVKNDAPYMGFVDEKGQLQGFEIDLVADLAKRMGVKIEYTPVKASNRIQLLQQKRIDLIFATVSHYRGRDKVVDFSISYLYTPQTVLVRKDSGIRKLADLAGKRVAADAASGTLKELPARQPGVTVQAFQSWPDCFFALQQGTVDGVATDNILLAGLRAAAPKPDDYVLLGKEGFYSGGHYGVVLRENDSKSRDAINFLLQDQWTDGTWKRAFEKWLGAESPLKLTLADFDDFAMEVWHE